MHVVVALLCSCAHSESLFAVQPELVHAGAVVVVTVIEFALALSCSRSSTQHRFMSDHSCAQSMHVLSECIILQHIELFIVHYKIFKTY